MIATILDRTAGARRAHAGAAAYIRRGQTDADEPPPPTIYPRSMRQFGTHLPPAQVPNAGIGPRLDFVEDRNRIALLRPTRAFAESIDLEVAGVRMQLRNAPGETEDQIFVWPPDSRVLLAADNLYRSFPNVHAIRGTPRRDVRRRIASLDAMRALRPAHLVPSRTPPISGEAEVMRVLTDSRAAIQFVHDQTIRWMNAGLSPDEIVERVKLPPHLAASPWLAKHYGRFRRGPAAAARSPRRPSALWRRASCSGPRKWPTRRAGSRRTMPTRRSCRSSSFTPSRSAASCAA
jgi:glyoxylase-like metal-dependent hydrolase (beta-lactamase superfamily II)